MENVITPVGEMDRIALAFSGGGFRAACYSLGCLSYLNGLRYKDNTLLQHVKYISSTSGGSITNLMYSSFMSKQGAVFDAFYQKLNSALNGEKLLSRVMEILRDDQQWKTRTQKSRNLINAFSLAYNEALFEGDCLNQLSFKDTQFHLEEVCITSTEFTNGFSFRFQSQPWQREIPKGLIGNAYIHFLPNGQEAAGRIYLSDILASSSCFPSGFEPMIFPNDYTHGELTEDELLKYLYFKTNSFSLSKTDISLQNNPFDEQDAELEFKDEKSAKMGSGEELIRDESTKSFQNIQYSQYDLLEDKGFKEKIHFGIMDGGIVDNQAIDAFMIAEQRRKKKGGPGFDLFIACDVTSYFMNGYSLPMESKQWYMRPSIFFYIVLWLGGSLLLPLLLCVVKVWTGLIYIVGTISGIMAVPVLILLYKLVFKSLRSKGKHTNDKSILMDYLFKLKDVRLGALVQMILARIKSVLILSNDVYLKQIRRLYYDSLYMDKALGQKTVHNAIYDLSYVKFPSLFPSAQLHPSKVMREVAEKARTMETTLWFDKRQQKEDKQNCIIATGQFTTCFNLLKHLDKMKNKNSLSPDLLHLHESLQKDWELFLANPFFKIPKR
jgi:Patatin-like phospholipase